MLVINTLRSDHLTCFLPQKILSDELSLHYRPTSRSSGGTNQNNNGVALPVGLADDQAKDFDFEKTEMKYDSTGMFHWGPAKNLEDCLLVICIFIIRVKQFTSYLA